MHQQAIEDILKKECEGMDDFSARFISELLTAESPTHYLYTTTKSVLANIVPQDAAQKRALVCIQEQLEQAVPVKNLRSEQGKVWCKHDRNQFFDALLKVPHIQERYVLQEKKNLYEQDP